MAEDVDDDLLELRIHGIRNTPPHEMLQTQKGNTCLYRGDRLAGFSTTRRRPATDTHRVEAYSWGGLARFTGFPDFDRTADVLGRAADTLVRVVWLFLAPFGLANAAYWARARLAPEARGSGRSGDERTLDDRRAAKLVVGSGPGAGTVRCLGFLMTLLFITSVTVVVFEMARPWIRESMAGEIDELPAGATTALLVLVPALALGTLALLPFLARTRYLSGTWRTGTTPATGDTAATDAPAAPGPAAPETGSLGIPALAQPHFWRVGSGMAHLSMAHVGGGLAWIGGILALARILDENCAGRLAWNTCAVPATDGGQFWVGWSAVAVVLSAAVSTILARPRAPGGGRQLHYWLILAGGAVVVTAATITTSRSGGIPAEIPAGSVAFWVLSGVVALMLLLVAGQSLAGSRGRRESLGWFGLGPVVLSCVAVAFAQGLTFFVVRAAGWAFGIDRVPDLFTHLGAGFAVLTAGIVLLVLVRAAVTWATRRGPEPSPTARESLERAGAMWPEPADTAAAARLVRNSRNLASFLRRAETFMLWLAGLAFISLCVGVLHGFRWLTDDPQTLPWFVPIGPAWGIAGMWAAVGLVVLVVVLSSRNESRPLSLLWDLMCFLPTQAHPFGPPCYSERVVPEMADRIEDWLRGFDKAAGSGCRDTADDDPPGGADPPQADGRRVILAAHSMGIVLAISALFHLHARGLPAATLERIGMVSYGVQVRRYFARFFPGVFGPHILSLVPAESPAILGRDPWPPHLEHERDGTPAGHPVMDLETILGDRWINLYRPNDPLGFPLRYGSTAPAKDMDRHAEEFDPSAYRFTVAAHLNYLPTRAYRQAIRDLAGRLHPPIG